MVRRDSDRGYHPGVLFQASGSPLPRRGPREQLRERSRAAFADRASAEASSSADPSTGGLRSQAVQGPKPKSGSGPSNRLCPRYNSALPCTLRHRQAAPTSAISGPPPHSRPPCSRHSLLQETDTALVGELHQKAQNAVGPSARKSACTPDQLQSQNAPAAEQGRPATKVLCTPATVVPAPARGGRP